MNNNMSTTNTRYNNPMVDLKKWYKNEITDAGRLTAMKDKELQKMYASKVVNSMEHLTKALDEKMGQVEEADRKLDLTLMKNSVVRAMEHVVKDYGLTGPPYIKYPWENTNSNLRSKLATLIASPASAPLEEASLASSLEEANAALEEANAAAVEEANDALEEANDALSSGNSNNSGLGSTGAIQSADLAEANAAVDAASNINVNTAASQGGVRRRHKKRTTRKLKNKRRSTKKSRRRN